MSTDALQPRTALVKSGRGFEALAETFLQQRGLKTIARNFACRAGEIDLIMLDGDMLVFIEVRYRRSGRFGGAATSVDHRKQSKIIRVANVFLQGHRQFSSHACRFDVVALEGPSQAPTTDWIAGAFSA